jgi:hypothetical protein
MDLRGFYEHSLQSTLFKLGFAVNNVSAMSLQQEGWVYIDGVRPLSRWDVLKAGSCLSLIHNKYVYWYLFSLNRIFKKYRMGVRNLYYSLFARRFSGLTAKARNWQQSFHYLLHAHQVLSYFQPCFLTLTFFMDTLVWSRLTFYEFIWGNWLNFNSHNWRYLS